MGKNFKKGTSLFLISIHSDLLFKRMKTHKAKCDEIWTRVSENNVDSEKIKNK
tara:strand:- start:3056 stop:3214 length:159 start_codon:yes stop_codon:yes gene_type:complete